MNDRRRTYSGVPHALNRTSPRPDIQTSRPRTTQKLNVLVSLDPDLASARVNVRGTLTPGNLGALFAIVRRTNAFLPGMSIALDLADAQADAAALSTLHTVSHDGVLPSAIDFAGQPCRLRILEPRAA